jgi:predicted restriction endonuclease
MSATFDRLFDRGLLTISPDHRVILCTRLRDSPDSPTADLIASQHGKQIIVPNRFLPDEQCLDWHRNHSFNEAA